MKINKIIAQIAAFATLTSCESNRMTADSIDKIASIGITVQYCANIKVGKPGAIPRGTDVYPISYLMIKKDNGVWTLIEIAGHGGDELAMYPGDDYDHNIYENISNKEYKQLFEQMHTFRVKPFIGSTTYITYADMYQEDTSDYGQSKSPIKIFFAEADKNYYWFASPETMDFYYDFFNKIRGIAKKRGSYLEVKYERDSG